MFYTNRRSYEPVYTPVIHHPLHSECDSFFQSKLLPVRKKKSDSMSIFMMRGWRTPACVFVTPEKQKET